MDLDSCISRVCGKRGGGLKDVTKGDLWRILQLVQTFSNRRTRNLISSLRLLLKKLSLDTFYETQIS